MIPSPIADPTIIWALLTGAVTGGAWVGIVLLQRHRRLASEQLHLVEQAERQLEELADVGERLSELEARLNFAERRLAERETPGLSPPAG
jgi:hypothetical protein